MRTTRKYLDSLVESLNARTGKHYTIGQRNGYTAIDEKSGLGIRNIEAGLSMKEAALFLRGMLATCYDLNITQD